MSGGPRLLAVSNGHGEDEIACRVLDALRPRVPGLRVEAWAMVGRGAAYRARGVPVVGPANLLPSEGFGTLGLRSFLRDLAAGFVSTHWRQILHARGLRGRHDVLLGVGDVVPLAAAWLSGTPMAFVASAKSAYYVAPDGHTALERRLMRRWCVEVFPPDARTAEGFARTGVPCRPAGNPMMDGLGAEEAVWPLPPGAVGVAMLAGSRADATENALFLLAAAARLAEAAEAPARLRFLFPLHPSVDRGRLAGAPGWRAEGGRLSHPSGAEAAAEAGVLGPMLRASTLAVGLAGTANEQAIGLGLPLVTAPGAGNQGPAYVRMKMAFFGEAALAAPRDTEAVAAAVRGLLADPARRARMAAAGRERMGGPGASAAIAEVIAARLRTPAGGAR